MVDTSPISDAVPTVQLPNFFPQQNTTVEEEKHVFNVFQKDYSIEPQTVYQLDKAPVDEIILITGTYESETIEFTKGEDYTLSSDRENVVWNESARTPNPGTPFFVTYESDSILKRYLQASSEENKVTQESIVESINAKFIDTASGEDLDRIGALFGETVGQRRGRSDGDYRAYLKSVVRSFISRGTVSGIKLAISAATGVPIEDITIRENFESNEYEVVVIPQTPVTGTTIEEIAEIADPSGVEQFITRFTLEPDVTNIDDSLRIKPGLNISFDTAGATDSTTSTRREFTDIQSSVDIAKINPNSFDSGVDTVITSDVPEINGNKFDAGTEEASASGIVEVNKNTFDTTVDRTVVTDDKTVIADSIVWDDTNWNEFNWAAENN